MKFNQSTLAEPISFLQQIIANGGPETLQYDNLNKVFDSRIRLGIMSAVLVNTEVNFKFHLWHLKYLVGNFQIIYYSI